MKITPDMCNIDFAALLKKVRDLCCCCCKPAEGDDRDNLLDHEQTQQSAGFSENSASLRVLNGSAGSPGGSRYDCINRPSAGNESHVRTQSELEDDAVTKILDKTQQSIIDVNCLEPNDSDADIKNKTQQYAEAILKHDAQITENSALATTEMLLQPISRAELTTSLAESATDKVSDSDVALLDSVANIVNEVLAQEANIECEEELVAYMTATD